MNKVMNSPYATIRLLFVTLFFSLAACGSSVGNATPYLPPSPVPSATPSQQFIPSPTIQLLLPRSTTTPTPTFPCLHNLDFLDDLTIPDYSNVAPASILEKQWLVQNTGNCAWDSTVSLHFIGGELMGAESIYPLPEALPGEEATITINFTAPEAPGSHISLWQAYDSTGNVFGEAFMILVIVQP